MWRESKRITEQAQVKVHNDEGESRIKHRNIELILMLVKQINDSRKEFT